MTKTKCSVLVVDDEPYILATLAALLAPEFDVITADHPEAAQRQFAHREIDIILTDQKMPRMSGVQLLEWVRKHHPKTVRLLMTGFAELEEAVEAINRGQVFRYISKPWHTEELQETLRSAARSFILERSNEQLMNELRKVNEQLRTLNQELERRVAERTRQLDQRTKELEELNHELEQKNKMLEKLALTDPLTGLPNRRAMDRLAERELRRRERYPSPLTIGLIDVDHFKAINERYLLPGGDKVLVDLAKALGSSLRTVDLLGRIGGEEFLLIAPETDMSGAIVLGERIRTTIENTEFTYKDEPIYVRVSIGFAVADAGIAADYDDLKHLAASALADAKRTGRNRCVYYNMPKLPFEQAG
ncbi:MAG: diguanylate cyclase [Gemmataceae bacterium]|nr:diguanylate cyclase [Gemmataceae bacterium]